MKVFRGDNPTQLYFDSMLSVLTEGEEHAPRGKKIKELRPVCFEFTNPLNRTTFLKGRSYNPFFQLAESTFWIPSGRSDVEWLKQFNSSIGQFSDDGVYFNASYGERIRRWGSNDLHHMLVNPLDQLEDCYTKLSEDPDTRQAVIVISNPSFDNSNYTVKEKGKDIACNLVITFKNRNGKLDATVFNRSNDLHWGVFGANLAQFSTLQEILASWLYLEVGTYTQITDSLHVYLEDYGSKCTDGILKAYDIDNLDPFYLDAKLISDCPSFKQFEYPKEPRFDSGKMGYDSDMNMYWTLIDIMLSDDHYFTAEKVNSCAETVWDNIETLLSDSYLKMSCKLLLVYRLYKTDNLRLSINYLAMCEDSQWKVACSYFLWTL
jgi:thymidylate synthase